MKVFWLRNALKNLHQAVSYIAKDDSKAAAQVASRIREVAQNLASHPYIGRSGRVEGTRELVIPGLPFLMIYRIKNNRVEILRIHHTAQLWPEES
jgi:toxin ParE1/3/4